MQSLDIRNNASVIIIIEQEEPIWLEWSEYQQILNYIRHNPDWWKAYGSKWKYVEILFDCDDSTMHFSPGFE